MRRRGVVLVVVLWSMGIVAMVCFALGSRVAFDQQSVRRNRELYVVRQEERGALARAKALLLADDPAADTLADAWSDRSGPAGAGLLSGGDEFRPTGLDLAGHDPAGAELSVTDEAARLNANTADEETLARLPGFSGAAGAFVQLREDLAAAGAPAGPTGPIGTLPQLAALVREALGPGLSVAAGETEADVRTILRHLTVYSRVRNLDAAGGERIHLNDTSLEVLEEALVSQLGFSPKQARALLNARPFESVGELLIRPMVLVDEQGQEEIVPIDLPTFQAAVDRMTVTPDALLVGRVNVNTAEAEVLAALPGLTADSARMIIDYRRGLATGPERTDGRGPESIGWLLDVIDEVAFEQVCNFVTVRSAQFRVETRAVGERAVAGVETVRRGLGVLERDDGRCAVLYWSSWAGAKPPRPAGQPQP